MSVFTRIKKMTTTEVYAPRSRLINGVLRGSQWGVTAGLGYELHHVGLVGPTAVALGVLFFTAKVIGKAGWMLERDRARSFALVMARA